jgi:hypothetical protein
MATRASIKLSDSNGNFVANIYHHYDGYPEYLGNVLLELTSGEVVNGLTAGKNQVLGETFNGTSCLFATLVARLKQVPGQVYLHTEDDFGRCHEDYLYEVIENTEGDGVGVFVKNIEGEWEFVKDVLDRVSQVFGNDVDKFGNRIFTV